MKSFRFILGLIAAAHLANALPRFAEVVEPTDEYPETFLPFHLSFGADAASNNVAEYVRENHPGDTMVFTSHENVTGLVVRASDATATVPVAMDGPQGYATIPETMPDEAYMCWAVSTSGAGAPFMVNTAEAWWVGPDLVAAGEPFAVHGRNLRDAWCYIGGQWIEADESNPYRAVFTAPALGDGTHVLHVHNGTGGRFGWSAAKTITLRDKVVWSDRVYNVADYGATGNGVSNDLSSIQAAINAADKDDWSTVYFPAGTYTIADSIVCWGKNKMRFRGDGMSNTTIRPHTEFANSHGKNSVFYRAPSDSKFQDLAFESRGANSRCVFYGKSGDRYACERVRFSQYHSPKVPRSVGAVNIGQTKHVRFEECEFYLTGFFSIESATQVEIDRCRFYGMNDNEIFIKQTDGRQIMISGCVFQNYDNSDESSKFGWAEGRLLNGAATGPGSGSVYFGQNQAINLAPRPKGPNLNTGEFVMFEGENARWRARPTSVTTGSVTLAGISGKYGGHSVYVVEGKGCGQSRIAASVDQDTITLDRPWLVTPDAHSVITIANNSHRIIVFNNELEGDERVLGTTHYGTTLAEPYGGGWEWMVDGNSCENIRFFIHPFSMWKAQTHHDADPFVGQPLFFCVYQNNSVTNLRFGLAFQDTRDTTYGRGNESIKDHGYIGQVARRNTLKGVLEKSVFYAKGAPESAPLPILLDENVFEASSATATNFANASERDKFKLMGNRFNGANWD